MRFIIGKVSRCYSLQGRHRRKRKLAVQIKRKFARNDCKSGRREKIQRVNAQQQQPRETPPITPPSRPRRSSQQLVASSDTLARSHSYIPQPSSARPTSSPAAAHQPTTNSSAAAHQPTTNSSAAAHQPTSSPQAPTSASQQR